MSNNNVGLDFGTTYSVVSKILYDKDGRGYPDYCRSKNGSSDNGYHDSLIAMSKNDGELVFCDEARDYLGDDYYTAFRGFKVKLADDIHSLLNDGYTEEITPEYLTDKYINHLLNECRFDDGNRINKLVVGIPEIWLDADFDQTKHLDCRNILKKILENINFVDEVEIQGEPYLACAYFANNYLLNTGNKYKGKLLVIDFGGGTLDIILCEVTPNERSGIIRPIHDSRIGMGYNEKGHFGKAGLAFMQDVTESVFDENSIKYNKDDALYWDFISELEHKLMKGTTVIRKFFEENNKDMSEQDDILDNLDAFEFLNDIGLNEDNNSSSYLDKEFAKIKGDRGKRYSVCFKHLYNSFNKIIKPDLEKALIPIKDKIKDIRNEEGFRVALVGGFCNFYLNEFTIKQILGGLSSDSMYRNDIYYHEPGKSFDEFSIDQNRRFAVSYGAALLADEAVEFPLEAPYYLGIASDVENSTPYFAFSKGDSLVTGKPILVRDKNGEAPTFWGSRIPRIVFSKYDSNSDWEKCAEVPRKDYENRLTLDGDKFFKLGFSLNKNLHLTLHKWLVDENDNYNEQDDEKVYLGDIYDVLGSLHVK